MGGKVISRAEAERVSATRESGRDLMRYMIKRLDIVIKRWIDEGINSSVQDVITVYINPVGRTTH